MANAELGRRESYTGNKFLIEDYNQNDSLLFVPIILEHDLRDKLRKYLIEKQVYLPIHWPLEERINNVFEKELSLICDQRYTKKGSGRAHV